VPGGFDVLSSEKLAIDRPNSGSDHSHCGTQTSQRTWTDIAGFSKQLIERTKFSKSQTLLRLRPLECLRGICGRTLRPP
jgi:hypothetical protein